MYRWARTSSGHQKGCQYLSPFCRHSGTRSLLFHSRAHQWRLKWHRVRTSLCYVYQNRWWLRQLGKLLEDCILTQCLPSSSLPENYLLSSWFIFFDTSRMGRNGIPFLCTLVSPFSLEITVPVGWIYCNSSTLITPFCFRTPSTFPVYCSSVAVLSFSFCIKLNLFLSSRI